MTDKRPEDQFQIGDRVIYKPEGIITSVTGYVWGEQLGSPPFILFYQLHCGVDVHRDHIERMAGVKTLRL